VGSGSGPTFAVLNLNGEDTAVGGAVAIILYGDLDGAAEVAVCSAGNYRSDVEMIRLGMVSRLGPSLAIVVVWLQL